MTEHTNSLMNYQDLKEEVVNTAQVLLEENTKNN